MENYNILLKLLERTKDLEEDTPYYCQMSTLIDIRDKVRGGPRTKPKLYIAKPIPEGLSEEEVIEFKMKEAKAKETFERYHKPRILNVETIFKPYIQKAFDYTTTGNWSFLWTWFQNDLGNYNLYQQEVIAPIKAEILETYGNDDYGSSKAEQIDCPGMVNIYLDSKIKKCENCYVLTEKHRKLEGEVKVLREVIAKLKEKNKEQQELIDSIKALLEK